MTIRHRAPGREPARGRTIRSRLTVLVSAATAALLVFGGIGSIQAFFSDTASGRASATAGTSVATVTGEMSRDPLEGNLTVDIVAEELKAAIIAGLPNGMPSGIDKQVTNAITDARPDIADAISHLNYFEYTATIENTGTTTWTGDLRLFDHFADATSEQGVVFAFSHTDDQGNPQNVRQLMLTLIAMDIAPIKVPSVSGQYVYPDQVLAAGLSGQVIKKDTPATSAMPDGSAAGQMVGSEADPDLGGVTLAPGESVTRSYLVFARAHELGTGPYPDLTVGMEVDAQGLNGSTVTGWTADAYGTVTKPITLNQALARLNRHALLNPPVEEEESEEVEELPTEEPTPPVEEEPTDPVDPSDPSDEPTEPPRDDPSDQPSDEPTDDPSEQPTEEPTEAPTRLPSAPGTVDGGYAPPAAP